MPKTTSVWLLKHYPPLREIAPDDWDEIFHQAGKPWDEEEDEYIRQWYGREPAMNMAYALGRTSNTGRASWKLTGRSEKMSVRQNSSRILMSIKPEFAYQILDGKKFYEYRRVLPRESFTKVVVYASSPVQRFIGEFDVDEVITGDLEDVWNRTRYRGGILKDYYDRYFSGKTVAHALHVVRPIQYRYSVDPKDIIADFHPPQSFSYLTDELYVRIEGASNGKILR